MAYIKSGWASAPAWKRETPTCTRYVNGPERMKAAYVQGKWGDGNKSRSSSRRGPRTNLVKASWLPYHESMALYMNARSKSEAQVTLSLGPSLLVSTNIKSHDLIYCVCPPKKYKKVIIFLFQQLWKDVVGLFGSFLVEPQVGSTSSRPSAVFFPHSFDESSEPLPSSLGWGRGSRIACSVAWLKLGKRCHEMFGICACVPCVPCLYSASTKLVTNHWANVRTHMQQATTSTERSKNLSVSLLFFDKDAQAIRVPLKEKVLSGWQKCFLQEAVARMSSFRLDLRCEMLPSRRGTTCDQSWDTANQCKVQCVFYRFSQYDFVVSLLNFHVNEWLRDTPWLRWVEPQWREVGRCVQNSQLLRHWKKATNAIDSTFQELLIWLMNARHIQEAQLAAEWHQKRSANTKDHRERSEYDDPWACWKCIFHTCQYHSARANRLDDFKTLLDGKNWILWHLALDSKRQRQNAKNSQEKS